MGHGLYSSFEARKSAHLPSERKCVRPGMTETVQALNLNSSRAYDDFLILKLAR